LLEWRQAKFGKFLTFPALPTGRASIGLLWPHRANTTLDGRNVVSVDPAVRGNIITEV